jgi:hypothetical protein
MSVIINEFEILVDPPTTRSAEAPPPPQAPAPLRPEEIERIVRHFEGRRLRVDAD